MSTCQLCQENKQEWAVIVPLYEYNPPIFNRIDEEHQYEYPHWLICTECKDTGKVEERRKQMYNFETKFVVEEI